MPKHTVAYSLSAALKQLADDREQRVLELDRWAEIGDRGATDIANALRTNEHLEVLILGSQHIGPAGAQALGEALRKHMRLKELHLHNNKLGYAGVAKLAEELALPLSANSSRPGNKILEVLVLRNNAVGPHCPGGSVCTTCRFSPNFPASLLELTSLRLIDLNTNELIFVPHDIAKMPKLIGLDIRKNAIENIPDQVMVTARMGHQSGWLALKEWMLGEIRRLENPDAPTSVLAESPLATSPLASIGRGERRKPESPPDMFAFASTAESPLRGAGAGAKGKDKTRRTHRDTFARGDQTSLQKDHGKGVMLLP